MALAVAAEKLVPLIVAAIQQAATFEAGKPVTISVPPESITLDLSREGLGTVTVAEAGTTLTICKA